MRLNPNGFQMNYLTLKLLPLDFKMMKEEREIGIVSGHLVCPATVVSSAHSVSGEQQQTHLITPGAMRSTCQLPVPSQRIVVCKVNKWIYSLNCILAKKVSEWISGCSCTSVLTGDAALCFNWPGLSTALDPMSVVGCSHHGTDIHFIPLWPLCFLFASFVSLCKCIVLSVDDDGRARDSLTNRLSSIPDNCFQRTRERKKKAKPNSLSTNRFPLEAWITRTSKQFVFLLCSVERMREILCCHQLRLH